MKTRSALLGGSFIMGSISLVSQASATAGGLFAPTACVSPAFLVSMAVALTSLPTDTIGEIVQDRWQNSES